MENHETDFFQVRATLNFDGKAYQYFSIKELEKQSDGHISSLPYSIKVLLEAAVRELDGRSITEKHVESLANWEKRRDSGQEIPFKPARVLLHDTTGVPALVDLAAMRSAMYRIGGDVSKVNPFIQTDLVIDHSVTVDRFGDSSALRINEQIEFERNTERFRFLRWAQNAFDHLRVVPPSTGIMHQINIEYLSTVAAVKSVKGSAIIYPDSLVGADSHTTMINGLGVVAWGVGGIEAEAGMLGQPLYFEIPQVVGFKMTGFLPDGATATDLALTVTRMLREKGVVGQFVEFFGPGVRTLGLADRTTISNMAPEYGATMGIFPVDQGTLNGLRSIGRSEKQVALIERYYKAQGMFMDGNHPEPAYSDTIELDLSTVVPCLAGPRRPQDRIPLTNMKQAYHHVVHAPVHEGGYGLSENNIKQSATVSDENKEKSIVKNGSVVLAAITSCTNTSNPNVLLGAGLVAKKAIERGMIKPAHVKTSFTPGSRVVIDYLKRCDLLKNLEQLGFHVAGFGCATCIGNSGPLPEEVSKAVEENDLVVAAVLSGNRNFEGRVHPQVKANYLASPPLVVVYALTGTVDIDLENEPVGYDSNGEPVFLKEIWPTSEEIQSYLNMAVRPELFRSRYENIYQANESWNRIETPKGKLYKWKETSTYIQEPPFLEGFTQSFGDIRDMKDARVLAFLGDSVTTDHLSPSGSIKVDSPAGLYLQENGVRPLDFNSYPSRRGNHKVMMRGALANIRIRNRLVPGVEGGFTRYQPTNEVMSIFEASEKYRGTDLIVIAGKEYGTGSSRDWAAKGPYLLGVKMIIAESYERIHRSNLVGMGILPLQFLEGENAVSLGIMGTETFSTIGLNPRIKPKQTIRMEATRQDGTAFYFDAVVRLDHVVDIEYYQNGGLMPTIMRSLLNDTW